MKKVLLSLFLVTTLFSAKSIYGQNTWTRKSNYPGIARDGAISFTIGHYGFVGCGGEGSTYYSDFYKWNQSTNSWSSIAAYPGNGSGNCIAFTIEGKGYVGLGVGNSGVANDLWRYDSATNSWTQMANLPGTGRYDADCFVLGHKAYVIGGSYGGPPYTNQVWVYDAHANSWQQLNNYAGGDMEGIVAFAIGNRGYAGGGWDGSSLNNNFYQYDSTNDSWTSMTSLPVNLGGTPYAFVIGTTSYISVGSSPTANNAPLNVGYAYDTVSKSWTTFTDLRPLDIKRYYATAFAIGNYGYMALGNDSTGAYNSDLWQWGMQDTTVPCNTWTRKSNYPGIARDGAISFTIGHYGFVGCGGEGSTYYSDFYKWNQSTNSWSSIAAYPGNGSGNCIAFTIEGKGYVGLGVGNSGVANDLWRYDSATNSWTQMANLPGTGRYDADCFVLGHKAYVIGGSYGGPPYTNQVWVYDAHANSWQQLNNYAGGDMEGIVAFAIGNRGYAGGGWDGSSLNNNFYQYDSTNDSWTSMTSLPVNLGGTPYAFVIGTTSYISVGSSPTANNAPLNVGYAYDTVSKSWTTFTDLRPLDIKRYYATAFAIGNYGYMALGNDSTGAYNSDLWQWISCTLLGINELSVTTSAQILLSPNPSNGVFEFSYSGLNSNRSELRITDMLGKLINSYWLNSNEAKLRIDETFLQNGMYFYQLVNENEIFAAGKFIIAK